MPAKIWKTAPDLPAAPPQNGFALISNEKLFALYTAMYRSRLIGDRARLLLKQGQRSSVAIPPKGLEAALVGIALDLLPEDTLAPALWNQAPCQVINPAVTVAAFFPQALNIARENKASRNNKIVVLFSSIASPPSDAWLRILETASDERIPMLLVSWPAQPAAKTPRASRRNSDLGCSFPTINVDGSDVVAVHRVASEAIVHARKGNRPTLIECVPSPSSDPLKTMENYLIGKGLLTPAVKRKIAAALRSELESNMPIVAA